MSSNSTWLWCPAITAAEGRRTSIGKWDGGSGSLGNEKVKKAAGQEMQRTLRKGGLRGERRRWAELERKERHCQALQRESSSDIYLKSHSQTLSAGCIFCGVATVKRRNEKRTPRPDSPCAASTFLLHCCHSATREQSFNSELMHTKMKIREMKCGHS